MVTGCIAPRYRLESIMLKIIIAPRHRQAEYICQEMMRLAAERGEEVHRLDYHILSLQDRHAEYYLRGLRNTQTEIYFAKVPRYNYSRDERQHEHLLHQLCCAQGLTIKGVELP